MRINVVGAILVTAVLLVSMVGISTVLAKMPANFSTNPDVLKIEINQSGLFSSILVYHDLKAGYWDIGYTGKQRLWKGDEKILQGNISFPDSQINRFDVP
jgi:hypothetical protein